MQARTMALLDFNENAVNIISTPLYSLGALSTWMPTVYGGGCNAIMARFDVLQFLDWVECYSVTHTILVPEQYRRILQHDRYDDFDLSSLKFKFGGSAPSSIELKQDIAARMPGEMMEFSNPCIALEDVYCRGCYVAGRYLCPRRIVSYWREIWLERLESPPVDAAKSAEEES